MREVLDYDDVFLVPKFSTLDSRTLADTSVDFLGKKFLLPVVPSNMESVIDKRVAALLDLNKFFYIMHRFNISVSSFVQEANEANFNCVSISIGVNAESKRVLKEIYKDSLRVDFVTIDVAHGHHSKVRDMIAYIKDLFPSVGVIAGNITTPEALSDLQSWGADAAKLGIGTGSICTTKNQTGFSLPMFSSIRDCFQETFITEEGVVKNSADLPIIADGGIKNIGDIVKALVAGATMVMCGKLFVSCFDSPAKVANGKKIYNGSTSFEAKKTKAFVEGKTVEIESGALYLDKMKEIQEAIQSAVSYAGGVDLSCFPKTDFVSKY